MKKFKLFKLLALFVVLITSINAWGQTYKPARVDERKAMPVVTMQGAGMQSQQMMSGGAYNGTVYEPFSNATPSEASNPAKAPGGPRRAEGDNGFDPSEFDTPGDAGTQSSDSPIGEPLVMLLFALGFTGIIFIRKRKLNQTTEMKNTTKFIATLSLMLTLGVGQMWAGNNISADKRLYFFNGGEWNADVYLDIWKTSGNYHEYKKLTQLGSTHYWYWQSTKWDGYDGMAFYKAGDRDHSCTSVISGGDVNNNTIFVPNSAWNNNYWLTSYKYVTPSGGLTIYFDNTDFGFASNKIYFRSGFAECNEALQMTLVPGTANLYSLHLPNSYPFGIYTISESHGHTNLNSIYNVGTDGETSHIGKQMVYTTPDNNFSSEFTFYYNSQGDYNDSEKCQYYNYYTFDGHKKNVSITSPSHGTIRVDYTNESGSGDYFTSGNTNLAQTCILTITANPSSGYHTTGLTLDGSPFTSGNTHTLRSNITLAATFAANEYTLTFNKNSEAWSDADAATTKTRKIVYDAAYSSSYASQGAIPTMATKNGYYFKGWYTESSGGTKVINADGTWVTGVSGYTDGSGRWVHADDQTLYAQYAAPVISIGFSPENVLPLDTVTITPSFDHDPEGASTLCYVLVTASGQEMQVQPTWVPGTGKAMKFEAPSAPGNYSVDVRLFNANDHSCADRTTGLVSSYLSRETTFTVEEANAVTVKYMCGSVELRPSTTVYATAYQTAANVTAPEIAGLSFTGWTKDVQISYASGSSSTPEISIHASSDGTLTANYDQTGYVYFKNTLGWEKVYLHEYNNKYYWDDTYGTGVTVYNEGVQTCTAKNIEMSLVDGTDDVYYCKPASLPGSNTSWVFTNETSEDQFFGSNGGNVEAVRVNDDYNSTNNMVVPEAGTYIEKNSNKAKYYTRYFFAPTLMNWGWNLRGAWNNTNAYWTNSDYWYDFTSTKFGSLVFTAKRYCDHYQNPNYMQVYTDHTVGGGTHYGKASAQINGGQSRPRSVALNSSDSPDRNITFKTNYPGEYVFTLTFGPSGDSRGSLTSNITLSVEFPVEENDFRLFYDDKKHPSDAIKKRANGQDTVSLFVAAGKYADVKVQSCTGVAETSVTWGSPAEATYATGVYSAFQTLLASEGSGVYNFIIKQNAAGTAYEIINVEKYTGRFYVRTDCIQDKWNYKYSKNAHAMTYSEYSTTLTSPDKPFSHYFVKDIHGTGGSPVNIKFTVANDFSEAITDTVINGISDSSDPYYDTYGSESLTRTANVRFTYDQASNEIWRAYTEGPTNNNYMVLRTDGAKVYESSSAVSPTSTYKFVDMGNWVYQIDVYATAPTYVKLTAEMHNNAGTANTQYLKGISGNGKDGTEYTSDDGVILLGGTAVKQHMRIVYDFKTDRMVTSWLPSGAVSGNSDIHADVMLIRNGQDETQQITFAAGDDNKLTDVKTVYGVMEIDSSYVNNVVLSRYARSLYWISFPFDVNVRDIFGFGTYGKHWILEYYDGMGRAKYGWWADSEPNWKYITPAMKDTFVLKANTGYVLALSLNRMADGCTDVWVKDVNTVYLYFPSATELGTIQNVANMTMPLSQTGYKCEIDRTGNNGADINKNRKIADSYWHCIGVPSFAQNSLSGTATSSTWASNIPFVYEWSPITNRLHVNTNGSFAFEPMHAYLVQYDGTSITWTNVSNKPSDVVARHKVEGAEADFYEWNLNLMQGAEELDHTYVRMTADENATDGFDFGKDLTKEISTGANIYTFSTYVPVAGNCIPLDLNTTKTVQVGVKIATDGDYTFALPEGTEGVGVVLIDNIAGTRTNLALTDYTVNLTAGTYDGRFLMEISPIAQAPTDIETISDERLEISGVRKVMVDGVLYIVKDGKVFDARGNRVQ